MRRLWLGIGLLVGLLVLGILTTAVIARIQEPIADTLEAAEEAVRQGDRVLGLDLSKKAWARWDRYRKMTASVTDHTPMEEIDALFEAMAVYGEQGEWVLFRACCAKLSAWVRAVSEAQSVTWWSVF